jgi:phasin family protein
MPDRSNKTADPSDDFVNLIAQMQFRPFPGADKLVAANFRNIDALSAANRIALEGAQTVAYRQMEIMYQAVTELSEGMQALPIPRAPQANTPEETDVFKRIYEHAVANTRDLSDLIQRCNRKALDPLHKRFIDAVHEIGSMSKVG